MVLCLAHLEEFFLGLVAVSSSFLGTSMGGASIPQGIWNSIKEFARAQTDDPISKKLKDEKSLTLLGYVRIITK